MIKNIFEIVNSMLHAQHALLQIEANLRTDADEPEENRKIIFGLVQVQAHREIIAGAKELEKNVSSPYLTQFISEYESYLSETYSDWEKVIFNPEPMWTLTNAAYQESIRIVQIEKISELLTGLFNFLSNELPKIISKSNSDATTCQVFDQLSSNVFKWVKSQKTVGEETLTDWFLYNISLNLKFISYFKFKRHEEARQTGADWEWWFVENNKGICFRVQAKKLQKDKDNYDSLSYTNRYGLQIEKLIQDSITRNAIPFYSFYSATDSLPTMLCNRIKTTENKHGIFISPATKMYDRFILNGRAKVNSDDILSCAHPISCLICCNACENISDNITIDDIYSKIREQFGYALDTISNSNSPGWHEEIPGYVSTMIDSDPKELSKWFESEYRHQLDGINSLLVVNLNDNSKNQKCKREKCKREKGNNP